MDVNAQHCETYQGNFFSYLILNAWHYYTLRGEDIWAISWENLFMPYENNKCADQPAHPCSLLSTFVVRCLDSTVCILAITKVSRFFCSWTGWFESYLVANPEDRLSHDVAYMIKHNKGDKLNTYYSLLLHIFAHLHSTLTILCCAIIICFSGVTLLY